MNLRTIQHQIPFFGIIISYIPALVILEVFPSLFFPLLIFSVFLCLCLLITGSIKHFPYKRKFTGYAILVLIFLCGLINYQMINQFTRLPSDKVCYYAILRESPHKYNRYFETDCQVKAFTKNDTLYEVNEPVRLRLQDTAKLSLLPGDSVIFVASLHRIRNKGNPGEFDYAAYMSLNRIYYEGIAGTENFRTVENPGKYRIRRWAAIAAKKVIDIFRAHHISGDDLAVLSALTIGNRDYLDAGLKNDYVSAGAMHVLAVSGLHVGILFLFINLLLWRKNKTKFFRLVRFFATMTTIWFYAFLTGLSPSVMRAAVMFSFFQLAQTLDRPVNSFNILAASAFLILLVNPLELFKVGFQFSYLAVWGILYFYHRLTALWLPKNYFIDRLWQLLVVSISVQITTIPLTLYYFHQFPSYFWLTNLIIIPMVWLIMMTSIFLIIFTSVTFLSGAVAFLLQNLLTFQNRIVSFVGHLPFGQLTDIPFSIFQLIIYFIFLVMVLFALDNKRYKMCLWYFTIMVMINTGYRLMVYEIRNHQQEIVIYDNYGNDLISLINGHNQNLLYFGDDSIDMAALKKKYGNFWIQNGVSANIKITKLTLTGDKNEMVKIGIPWLKKRDCRFTLLHGKQITFLSSGSTDVASDGNILFIGGGTGFPDEVLPDAQLIDELVIGTTIPSYVSRAWKKYAGEHQIEFFDIRSSGAFQFIPNKK